jgi:hypothetical protein
LRGISWRESRGDLREEIRVGPSKRNGYLSWRVFVSGKPLLVKCIDAGITKKLHGKEKLHPNRRRLLPAGHPADSKRQ